MSELDKEISQQFKSIKKNEVTLLSTDINNYFKTILGTVKYLANDRNMGGVYISATRPSKAIISRLENEKINTGDIFFVDSVSYMSEGPPAPMDNVIFIESPTMLEIIITKTDALLKRIKSADKFVFFDSINALSIYNSEKILSEFLHVLINSLGGKSALSVLVSVRGQTPKDIESMVRMICDNTVEIRGE